MTPHVQQTTNTSGSLPLVVVVFFDFGDQLTPVQSVLLVKVLLHH